MYIVLDESLHYTVLLHWENHSYGSLLHSVFTLSLLARFQADKFTWTSKHPHRPGDTGLQRLLLVNPDSNLQHFSTKIWTICDEIGKAFLARDVGSM